MRLNARKDSLSLRLTPQRVNLATHPDSQAHSSKGTPSPEGSDGLKAHGFRNSFTPLPGYFSPFPHGTIHYRSLGSIQAYQVVLADSHEIPRVPCYSGTCSKKHAQSSPTGVSPTTPAHSNAFG